MSRFLFFVPLWIILASAGADEFSLNAIEKKILELTNLERKKKDLPALKPSPPLFKVAQAHSENMAKQEKMEHELDGKNPSQRIKEAGYAASWGGENIAESNGDTPESVVKLWMESPEHKANILRDKFTEIGVGIARNAKGEVYYTQVFAAPKKKR